MNETAKIFKTREFMRVKRILIILTMFLTASLRGQSNSVISMLSPKLRQFLVQHPAAQKCLNSAVEGAFTNRTVQIYYFYTDNQLAARYYHYYPAEGQVVVAIRENEQSSDEFIGLLFELLNSKNERIFTELFRKATSGEISRTDFATEILKAEFQAVIKTRDSLKLFKLTDHEILTSDYYATFSKCPDKFEDYLAYSKKLSPDRDVFREYELKFDLLQKKE